MLFTSLNFLVFFCLTSIVYYLLPNKLRWILLLTASLVFYVFSVPAFVFVLAGSILLNYLFGIWIDHAISPLAKRKRMIFGIVLNLSILAAFRYAVYFDGLISALFHLSTTPDSLINKVIVPLGISFFTFTNISYLIEVKRSRIPAERHLGYFACYIAFFPKLIQGPIERPQSFLPQLRKQHKFDYNGVTDGIRLMLWGFFKKLVIADQLSLVVNAVYDNNQNWHSPILILSTILFAFQIYMDFSGYIDIARGAARILGFQLNRNFDSPYLSTSIKDFWGRWHMSLSQWLRDYIFLPLAYYLSGHLKKQKYAGISTEKYLYAISITVTFLLCGLWHGVGWNFIVWGGIFAFYLIVGSISAKPMKRFYRKTGLIAYKKANDILQAFITFLLVSFAWIFFRAAGLSVALKIVSSLFDGWGKNAIKESFQSIQQILLNNKVTLIESLLVLLMIPFVMLVEHHFPKAVKGKSISSFPLPLRWGAYYFLVLLIFYFGKTETNSFIYFQF